ncbi:acyl carrier protein [Streptomyces sp. NPDC008313]|uniref:acyl carrier protein n=1 Tax=Streptomyces sp. NPDC008313 TaxID=3364826 RepID=UPI0036E8015B
MPDTTTAPTAALDKEELRELIADVLDLDVADVTDDADFMEDLDVDSLMALEITVRLEKAYGVRLAEAELTSITSLRGTYELLAGRLGDAR